MLRERHDPREGGSPGQGQRALHEGWCGQACPLLRQLSEATFLPSWLKERPFSLGCDAPNGVASCRGRCWPSPRGAPFRFYLRDSTGRARHRADQARAGSATPVANIFFKKKPKTTNPIKIQMAKLIHFLRATAVVTERAEGSAAGDKGGAEGRGRGQLPTPPVPTPTAARPRSPARRRPSLRASGPPAAPGEGQAPPRHVPVGRGGSQPNPTQAGPGPAAQSGA